MTYLCYYELHVEDQIFYIHYLVNADSGRDALDQMKKKDLEDVDLIPKGCLGEFNEDLAKKFMPLPDWLSSLAGDDQVDELAGDDESIETLIEEIKGCYPVHRPNLVVKAIVERDRTELLRLLGIARLR